MKQALALTLRETRIRRGLSPDDLAKRCHWKATYIEMVERELCEPSLFTLRKLAEGLDMRLSDLVRQMEQFLYLPLAAQSPALQKLL